jgi:hypothetical protein
MSSQKCAAIRLRVQAVVVELRIRTGGNWWTAGNQSSCHPAKPTKHTERKPRSTCGGGA